MTLIVKEELSAGGVVFCRKQKTMVDGRWSMDRVKFLLGKHSGYHKWVLPKGLVEKGEGPIEAALREVEEEVGVKARVVEIVPVRTIEYWYRADPDESGATTRRVKNYQENGGNKIKVHKRVIFYLMEFEEDLGTYGSPPEADQPWAEEMEERRWVSYEEGMKLLAFETEREVLREAWKMIGDSLRGAPAET